MGDGLGWVGPAAQLVIAGAGVFVAWLVGRGSARSSDRSVFTAQREHAIALATSDDEDKRVIGGLLIEELATSDLATAAELDTMAAISDALAKGKLSGRHEADEVPPVDHLDEATEGDQEPDAGMTVR